MIDCRGCGLRKLADKLRLKQTEYRRALRAAQASRKEGKRRIDEHHSSPISESEE